MHQQMANTSVRILSRHVAQPTFIRMKVWCRRYSTTRHEHEGHGSLRERRSEENSPNQLLTRLVSTPSLTQRLT